MLRDHASIVLENAETLGFLVNGLGVVFVISLYPEVKCLDGRCLQTKYIKQAFKGPQSNK